MNAVPGPSELTRLTAQLANVERELAETRGDDAATRLVERAELLAQSMALSTPRTLAEIGLKLDLLCARLRRMVDPTLPGPVVTYLLAESARDDLRRMTG